MTHIIYIYTHTSSLYIETESTEERERTDFVCFYVPNLVGVKEKTTKARVNVRIMMMR